MEPLPRNRFNWLAIAVAALVLLNIGLVASIWLQRPALNAGASLPAAGGARNLLPQDLGFDSAQTRRFEALRAEHQGLMQGYRREMRALKDQYFGALRSDAPAPDSVGAAIGRLQARIDRSTYDHFRLVRALCTREQKERFDRLLDRIIRHMGGPRPPMRGGGGHPDGPPPGEGPDGPPMDGPGGPDGPPPMDGPGERGPQE